MNDRLSSKIDFSDFENVYVSRYTPYISIETDWTQITENESHTLNHLAEYDSIERIYVTKEDTIEPNLEMAKYSLGVRDYLLDETSGYNGEGIVVGLLESGILNKNHDNFAKSNIQVRNEWYYFETVTDYATMMASLIVGDKGIAPKCKLLSVELYGDAVSEVDWMLDRNVNIINMSYGDKNPTGNYSSTYAYMDFVAATYKVTMVASSGNTGASDAYVANPGLGYNVLTVGACSSIDGYSKLFSSYIVNQGPRKPNIMAPGYSLTIPGFGGGNNGTSISAAITTGCIALLMQKDPILRYHPEKVISMLSATAIRATNRYFGNGLSDFKGAGTLSFTNIVNQVNNNIVYGLTNSHTVLQCPDLITANKNQTIRVAAAWLAQTNGNANGTTKTNYDLYLKNASGTIIARQETTVDCLELIEIKAPYSGKYSVEVRQVGSKAITNEYVSVSYFVD